MATWPTSLPLPSINMNGTVTRPKINTQMDGRNRSRRRWTGKQEVFSVSWVFDETEITTFETFVDVTLKGGSLFFDIDLTVDGALTTVSVRFQRGEYGKQYQAHNHWRISAVLEREIAQGVNDPDQTFAPLYFQPEFVITEDTLLGEQHRNALLRVQGVTTLTPIVLTTLFADNSAEYLPVGIQHEGGQGDVIIRMLEDGDDGTTVDPFTLATQLGIHIYSFEDPSFYSLDPGGGLDIMYDQNPDDTQDIESLRATDDSRKAGISGTALQCRITGNKNFEAFQPNDGLNGKGCFIMVANMQTSGLFDLLGIGGSFDRPKFAFNASNGGYTWTWGGGGTQNDSQASGAFTATLGEIALYMCYVPAGVAAPKGWVNGEDIGINPTDTGTWQSNWWWVTIFCKDDANESVACDTDIYEFYIATTGTGDSAEGLTEAQFLELAEAVAAKHGATWLGA